MKTEIETPEKTFSPITIRLTFETIDELKQFIDITNGSPLVIDFDTWAKLKKMGGLS